MTKNPRALSRRRALKINDTRKISLAATQSQRTLFSGKASALRVLLILASLGLVALLLGPIGFARKPAAQDRTPQAQSDFIRQFPLVSNDLVFSPSTNLLFASVPSSVGPTGNSIVSVDPATGISDAPVFVGSEPKKLALSTDGNSLYVFLDGSAVVRKFDVPTKTPGAQFALGQDNFFGIYTMTDMAVAPGNPDLVAIARSFRGTSPPEAGVAVFDHGVQRPTTTVGHIAASDFLSFSASPNTLYGGGNFSGLNTMTIDANGISITSSKTFGAGSSIRFDNGLVYGSTGQVINPGTGALAGTFSGVGSGPFTTDSGVGRAYFVTGSQSSSNYTATIRAFDMSTFLSVGTIDIPGVSGAISSLVRWGSNGLAFRTDGGQLFLIRTSLIPSGDPIPTPTPTVSPTPTPSASPFAAFVRQVSITNNDLAYNGSTQLFYASVPSSVGSTGNSVQSIDPATGTLGSPVFVGSEPTKLSIADDLQTMYVALDGAAAVRRFDLSTQTAGIQFPIGFGGSSVGPLFANELAVLPGNPNAVVVARTNHVSSPSSDGVAVYDNGVRRTKATTTSVFAVETSTNPNRLYSTGSSGVDRLTLDGTGVTYVDTVPMLGGGDIRFENGLIYGTGGGVVDPEAKAMKGSFTGFPLGASQTMTTDIANGRALFLSIAGSSQATLKAFDLNNFTPIGSVTFTVPNPGATSGPTRLTRWGTNGLAFRTGTQVFFIQTNLVSSSGSIPAATPSPSPSPSPTPTPYIPTFIRPVDLPANDLVMRNSTQTLYASVASTASANGNSISGVNPATGSIVSSVFIGSEPNKMAFSDDNRTLHVSLDGAAAIRTFDLETQTAGNQFTWGTANQRPAAMAVVPGSPLALAISDGQGGTVGIYDSGVVRPNKSNGTAFGISALAFASPSLLYGYDGFSSGFELVKLDVDSSGVKGNLIANNLVSGFSSGLLFNGGRLYSQGGRVVDPVTPAMLGTFQNTGGGFSSAFTVDPALHRAFFIFGTGTLTLSAFDTDTFLPVGSVALTGISGTPVRLVRWGTNGLAFNTSNQKQLYLLQSQLVSSAGTIPTSVQMNSSSISTFESVGTLNLNVNRTGDVSGTTTVDYATSDGTATAGSDYTATSGTLTFAPGQLSKTISIPIIDDRVFENGLESFTITLSNAGGGAVLTSPASTLITISDNESQPSVSVPSTFRATEGNSGTKVFTIPVTLSNASVQTVTMNYTTADGTATAGSDYVATSGTLTFTPGTTSLPINVTVNGDTTIEPDETFQVRISNVVNGFLSISQSNVTIANDDSSFQLSAASLSVGEGAKSVTVTVNRSGDLSAAASVNYATSDTAGNQDCNVANGKASARCDYIAALGRLNFVANQSSKTITILVIDDAYPEGDETFTLALSNPSLGFLGATPSSTITITDNDASLGTNPADAAAFFVRQNYLDFLNREPDQSGFNFWTGEITSCGTDTACIEVKRINVSAAFFLSIEFQQTGYLVERMYKVSYGDAQGTSALGGPHPLSVPVVRFNEFLQDTQRIGQGVVVNQTGWEQALENNKQAYAFEFVQTSRFANAFATTMTPAEFVDKLNQNGGNVLSPTERTAVIDLFSGAADSSNLTARAKAVRQVAEDADLFRNESNRAFVLSEFFGYLRRNPNDAPDADYTGYEFWLNKLNDFNGDYIAAEMVKAFISSPEYRQRFGQ